MQLSTVYDVSYSVSISLQGIDAHVGLPDFQNRNTGYFWTQKWVPVDMNVVLVASGVARGGGFGVQTPSIEKGVHFCC